MGRKNSGKQLEYELSASLRAVAERTPEFWYIRYPDYRDWIAVNKKLRAPKAPADFIALCRGKFIALEAKSTKGKYFRFDWLKDHQLKSLREIKDAGGESFIFFSKRGIRPVKAWALPIYDYIEMEKRLLESGRKSANIEHMAETGIELPRADGGMWNLTPIMDYCLR